MPDPHQQDQVITINLNHTITLRGTSIDGAVLTVLRSIAESIAVMSKQLTQLSTSIERNRVMTDRTLQEIVDDVAQEKDVATGISTMVTQLLAKAAGTPGLTPEQQASINAIADGVEANIASFKAALAAGTGGLQPTPPTVDVPPVSGPL